jgi:hypothetical protein
MSQQFLDQLLLLRRQLACLLELQSHPQLLERRLRLPVSQPELLSDLQLALRHLLFASFRPLLSELRLRLKRQLAYPLEL